VAWVFPFTSNTSFEEDGKGLASKTNGFGLLDPFNLVDVAIKLLGCLPKLLQTQLVGFLELEGLQNPWFWLAWLLQMCGLTTLWWCMGGGVLESLATTRLPPEKDA